MDPRRAKSPTGASLEPLEKYVYQRLKGLRLQIEGETLVMGVSGGIDSMVLAYVMAALKSRLGYKLHIVHVNHGIRGELADADAKFVKQLAGELKIPITSKKLKSMKSTASENLLREKRYSILRAVQKKTKAPFIVVAHHRDDLLETRLMRMLQGVGIHGLKAMSEVSADEILRPFLTVSRSAIKEYAIKKELRWRNDATNEDTKKLRNWIRRNWLSVLRREHPEYVDNLFLSLDRAIQQTQSPLMPPSAEFQRKQISQGDSATQVRLDEEIYNYLRQYAKGRVTSRHVSEFKKRLNTARKVFTFRLAGRHWSVNPDHVVPL
jgi:tRNA(Ile)-lysidine synthase